MGQPSPTWIKELDAARADFQQGDVLAAKERLVRLAEQYPDKEPILLSLLEVCMETGDWRSYAYYGEQLLPFEQGNDRAETLNNLVYTHMQLGYLVLAYHFAQKLTMGHPDFEHIEQVLSFVKESEPLLFEMAEAVEGVAGLPQTDQLNIMTQHERIRFYTEGGHGREAIALATPLLRQTPDLVPVLNNLSLSHFMVGKEAEAVAAAQKVLALSPQNAHALGNMVRFTFLRGQFDEAQQYADCLAQINGDNPDLLMKKAEAFAFLGDDAKVREAYEHAKKLRDGILSPMMLHLAATAYLRQGNEKTAWRLWQQAVKHAPDFDMARRCLAERKLPVGQRDVPWYWSVPYWGTEELLERVKPFTGKDGRRSNEAAVKQVMLTYLQERPYLPRLFSSMLERGDANARKFVMNFVRVVQTPELLQILYDFGRGKYGSDEQRMGALQFLSEVSPEMLPANRQVPVWINGEQTEVHLIGFEITDEPELVDLPEAVLEKYETAYDLLANRELVAAEKLLHEVMAAAPDFPSVYNQLAAVYERQGRMKEARALVEETYARFPDYFFVRTALAQMWLRERRVQEAQELLDPLFRLTKLHISEFRALARAQMEIALVEDLVDVARSWLSMWQEVDKENPELDGWEMRINGPLPLPEKYQGFLARRRKRNR